MQRQDATTPSFKPIYRPISINAELSEEIGSLAVVFKNLLIIFRSDSDGFEELDTFHTFDMESHEIKEGKLEGSIPYRIAENGACLFDENTILLIGNSGNNLEAERDWSLKRISEDPSKEYRTLYLLTISENIEQGTVTISSKIWKRRKSAARFKKIHTICKHEGSIFAYGEAFSRNPQAPEDYFSRPDWYLAEELWKLDSEYGEWYQHGENVNDPMGDRFAFTCFDGELYSLASGKNYYSQPSWTLSARMIMPSKYELKTLADVIKNVFMNPRAYKENQCEWETLKKNILFPINSWITLAHHDKKLYAFVGESSVSKKETKMSGFYNYDQARNEFTLVQFRDNYPPKIAPQACIAYKESLFILNPKSNSNKIFQIIMSRKNDDLDKRNLFMNKNQSDLTIKVEGKDFYCHKFILSAASKFFHDMFRSGMKESIDKELEIPDVKASVFAVLLRYIYCEELEIKDDLAVDLYELSDRWLISDLNATCLEFLRRNINVTNFGKIAEIAIERDEEELLEAATNYGLKNCGLLEEDHLKDVSSSVLRKMICKCQKVELRKKKKKN